MANDTSPNSPLRPVPLTSFAGLTLEEAMRKEPAPWPSEQVMMLMQSIAAVISGLHAQAGAHGGLNPRNIRFDDSGRVLLDNFGRFRDDSTQSPPDRLEAHYLTPEQSLGDAPNAQSDIYALGSLTFELLTGKPLFDGDGPEQILYQHRTAKLPSACALRPELNPEIDKVLSRALARDPRERFHLVTHLVDGMKRALVPPQSANDTAGPAIQEATQRPQDAQQQTAAQSQSADVWPGVAGSQSAAPKRDSAKTQAMGQTRNILSAAPATEVLQEDQGGVAAAPPVTAPTPVPMPAPAQEPSAPKQSAGVSQPSMAQRPSPLASVGGIRSPGTEVWTAAPPPPPPAPPRKGRVPGIVIAVAVIGAMIWGIRHQPPPPRYETDVKEMARLRKEYLDANPPKLLPFPDEAKKSGILNRVLLTDYLSLLVEQYKGLYVKLFSELEDAKKKAEGAEREAKRLQQEVRTGKAEVQGQMAAGQRQLAAAQAEARRAGAAVQSAKRSVDAANSKMNYFQGEYSRMKSQVASGQEGLMNAQP